MRAVVTGSTGFIGSHLVRALLARGDEVAVLVRPESARWRIDDVADRLLFLEATPVGAQSVTSQAAEFAPDALFHLAWAGVHGAGRDDAGCMAASLGNTVDVVTLAKRAGCRVIVGLGSQAEFGPCAGVIDESTPLQPNNAYGMGKLAAGLLITRTAATHRMRGVWLRLLSAYGPMDEPGYLIPYVIRELLAGRRPLLSRGDQPHDTLFCADVGEALRSAATSERCEGAYVLAGGDQVTVREIAETVRELVAPRLGLEFSSPAGHPGWRGSHRRLTEDTGWSPSTPLRLGLRETALWYRRHGDRP